jgi:hypothetical protein
MLRRSLLFFAVFVIGCTVAFVLMGLALGGYNFHVLALAPLAVTLVVSLLLVLIRVLSAWSTVIALSLPIVLTGAVMTAILSTKTEADWGWAVISIEVIVAASAGVLIGSISGISGGGGSK